MFDSTVRCSCAAALHLITVLFYLCQIMYLCCSTLFFFHRSIACVCYYAVLLICSLFPAGTENIATVDMFRKITFTYQFYVLAEIHFQDAHELVFQAEIHVHVWLLLIMHLTKKFLLMHGFNSFLNTWPKSIFVNTWMHGSENLCLCINSFWSEIIIKEWKKWSRSKKKC